MSIIEANNPVPPSLRLRYPALDLNLLFPVAVVVALIVIFSVTSPSFATWRNLTSVTGQAGTLLIVGAGATFIILMGSIDLSVGAIVMLIGAITVRLLNYHDIGLGMLLVAAVVGLALGAINGAIYAFGRIPSFIVTLGTLSIFTGVALQTLEGRAVQLQVFDLEWIAIGQIIPRIPNIFLFAASLWGIAIFIAQRTRFGRYMYLIGGGEIVAHTAGVPVRRYKIYAFALCGLFAALGAVVVTVRLGGAGPSLGSDLLLNSIAAIVVGGTSLAGGVGGPHRTLLGVLIIVLLDNGLNLLGVTDYTQMIIKGLVVVVAVLVSRGKDQGLAIK